MSLKTKDLLKKFCGYIYFAGVGNFWFEDVSLESVSYNIYVLFSFTLYVVMIFLENLAAFCGTLPVVAKKSAIMFAAIHNIVLIKMFLLIYRREAIKKLSYDMSNVGAQLEQEYVMSRQYKKVKVGILLYIVSVYLSLIAYGVESAREHFYEGAPFYTVVTYFPHYDDDSITAGVFRVIFYVTWLYMMLPMMSADCMPILFVIVLSYKFVALCNHFQNIREQFFKDLVKFNEQKALTLLRNRFLEGVVIHQNLQSLAKDIDRVFGLTMSLQVCESCAVAILLLVRLALSIHMDLTNVFMTYTFVSSLFLLLALNLWNAGELTHQASLVSQAMFSCGWEERAPLLPAHLDLRRLVLFSSQQAQRPLVLKAFGLQDLSYSTFVGVARMTYSIVAVIYNRKPSETN